MEKNNAVQHLKWLIFITSTLQNKICKPYTESSFALHVVFIPRNAYG